MMVVVLLLLTMAAIISNYLALALHFKKKGKSTSIMKLKLKKSYNMRIPSLLTS